MDVIIGIFAGVSSNLCSSIGVMTHKKLVDRRKCIIPISSVYREPMWALGASLFATALILDFVSLAFASVTIVGTLSVSNLIFNTIFARTCIGESITLLRGAAICCMAAGSSAVIASQLTADNISTSPTGYAILEAIRDWRILAYIVVTTISPAIITGFSHMCSKKPSLIYALSAGITATNCLLICKLIVDLIKNYHEGATNDDATEWWFTFASLLVLLVAGVFVQLQYMVHALEKGSAILGANIFGSTNVLTTIVCGGIVLDEFEYYGLIQWILLVIGVVATVGGIILLTDKEPAFKPCPVTDVFSVVVL